MVQSIPTTENEMPSINFIAGRHVVMRIATPAGTGPSTTTTIQSESIEPRPPFTSFT